jgi:hypothetical protein
VREDFQSQFAALAPSGAAASECFETAFDHGDHRFHLDAIAIGGEVESRLHQSAVAAAGWLGGAWTPGQPLLLFARRNLKIVNEVSHKFSPSDST